MTTVNLNRDEFNPNLFHPYYIIRSGLYSNIKFLSDNLNGDILDFGCGSKPYISLFKFNSYIGVDFVNDGHSHENENIDFYYDGKKLPFENNSFDSIICSEVFEHVFNLDEVLNELNRVLKTDGVILITCPFVWKEHELPNDFARYTIFALESILKRNGLKKVISIKSGNFFEVLIQLYVLFLFDHVYPYFKKTIITRLPFKFLFFLLPNLISVISRKFKNIPDTMYLNNVLLYKK